VLEIGREAAVAATRSRGVLTRLPTAPSVAAKVFDIVPAPTVTDAGTGTVLVLLLSVTAAPPTGATLESVTVQVLVVAGLRLVGLHASDVTVTGATREIVADCEVPL
jgi:hypothetical protein